MIGIIALLIAILPLGQLVCASQFQRHRRISLQLQHERLRRDDMGRVGSTWVGTDDTPSSGTWAPNNTAGTNLVKVESDLYDTYDPATEVFGDGNLTRVVHYPGGGAANQVTEYYYDWRDRQIASKSGVLLDGSNLLNPTSEGTGVQRTITYNTYDNLGEVTQTDQYDGDAVAMTSSNAIIDSNTDGVPDAPSSSDLRARATFDYDEQGRVWQQKVFSVDPSDGSVSSNSLRMWNWYDHDGNLIKSVTPGGPTMKYAYDGADRRTYAYITDGGGDAAAGASGTWSAAGNVTGDHVSQQNQTEYDDNGNPIFTITKMRYADATVTGALGDDSTNPKARVTYTASYYDAANRLTDQIDVGTNGGSTYTRPSPAPTTRSSTIHITHYDYDDADMVQTVTDPRGIVNKTFYDMLGRTTKSIDNYVNGTPSNSDDQTTLFTYDGLNDVLTMTADMPSGTNDQTTEYVYGVTTGGGSTINSNDLLKQVHYPNKSTGAASSSSSDTETYTYDGLGEKLTYTDRNGTTHTYSYDVLGRLTADDVTGHVGSGVDDSVTKLTYTYNTQGLPYQSTSYDSDDAVVNQVQDQYNGLGQLTTEWQEHAGSVDTDYSPAVQYSYTEMADDVNNSQRTSMIYPNGRELDYGYDSLGRVNQLSESYDDPMCGPTTVTLDSLYYLGFSTIVEEDHPENGVNLTLGNSSNHYSGLDQFGNIIDQKWTNGTSNLDDFQYAYDDDSNALYKKNTLSSGFSELYHASGTSYGYDGLNRIIDFNRGTLSDSNSDGVYDTVSLLNTLPGSQESWDLDAVGNSSAVTLDGTGTDRTTDSQNELTSVGSDTLTFDNDGNTTTDENGNEFVYDAWNRLVKVKDNTGTLLEVRSYDALGRKTDEKGVIVDGDDDYNSLTGFYYTDQDQVIQQTDENSCAPEGGSLMSQYVWSPAYVDDLILRDRDTDQDLDTGSIGVTGEMTTSGLDQRLYATHDANYNITALINTSGTVEERFVYDPYGKVTVLNASWATTSDSYNWQYLHQGGRYDPVSGTYEFRARVYSPTLQRWMQQDAMGYIDGANTYQSLKSSPVNGLDPQGHFDWIWMWSHSTIGWVAWYLYGQPNLYSKPNSYVAPSNKVATADDILTEFFNMVGPGTRNFKDGDFLTGEVQSDSAVIDARVKAQHMADEHRKSGLVPIDDEDTGETRMASDLVRMTANHATGGSVGNLGYVGSYHGDVKINCDGKGNYTFTYHVYNETSKKSSGGIGPNRPVWQFWDWVEHYPDPNADPNPVGVFPDMMN